MYFIVIKNEFLCYPHLIPKRTWTNCRKCYKPTNVSSFFGFSKRKYDEVSNLLIRYINICGNSSSTGCVFLWLGSNCVYVCVRACVYWCIDPYDESILLLNDRCKDSANTSLQSFQFPPRSPSGISLISFIGAKWPKLSHSSLLPKKSLISYQYGPAVVSITSSKVHSLLKSFETELLLN